MVSYWKVFIIFLIFLAVLFLLAGVVDLLFPKSKLSEKIKAFAEWVGRNITI